MRKAIEELCADSRLVEVNDVTALPARSGRPFVVGPLVNVYNEGTARFLVDRNAQTICPPVELPAVNIGAVAQACPDVEFEIFAFGVRLSPHGCVMVMVARIYRDLLDGNEDAESTRFLLSCQELPGGMVDGYFRGVAGCQPAALH